MVELVVSLSSFRVNGDDALCPCRTDICFIMNQTCIMILEKKVCIYVVTNYLEIRNFFMMSMPRPAIGTVKISETFLFWSLFSDFPFWQVAYA